MQGRGIIRVFLVLMTLVCLAQFILILPTRKVEKAADEYALAASTGIENQVQKHSAEKAARTAYLDSMSSEVVFSLPLLKEYTYSDLKKQQLALGLDLKGGMSVVLQVDLKDFILALSNNSKDPTFLSALETASEQIKTAQSDYVTLFADAFTANTEGKTLASIFSRNQGLRDQINYETDDSEVVRILREKANETVDLTFKRIKDRIDKFGVTQPNVSLDAGRDLIIVELPGVDNPERARSYLQASAKLEFWNVYRVSDPGVIESFIQADTRLKSMVSGTETEAQAEYRLEERYSYTRDSLTGDILDSALIAVDTIPLTTDPLADQGPLLSMLTLNSTTAGGTLNYPLSVMGVADRNKKNNIDELLSKPEIKALFPRDMEFRWSYKPMQDFETKEYTDKYELYAIRTQKGTSAAPLEGDRVTNAGVNPDPRTGEVTVSLAMDNRGTKIWGDMTTKAAQDNNREIAIVLDDEVVSAPRVNDAILSGNSSITGNFDIQEGKDLANILQVGKLPAKTKIIQESLVGPSLGKDNIRKSITALVVGFALVFIFMIAYYAGAGIVSILALLLNLFFIFGALASYGTVLTLPGIAGIVLTIGMAVDANVIIYERIREELRVGKSLLLSIKDGFANSYSAIIDANVTTLLTAFVLAYFGLGPIKGFAVVLIIGVLSSLFTAVLVGRLMIDWWTTQKGKDISFWNGFSANMFSNLNIDWIGKRKIAYVISGTIIALGFVAFFVRGFELGVDFKGGYSYNIEFEEGSSISADQLRNGLVEVFDGATPVVKAVDTRNTYNVVTSHRINDDSEDAANMVMEDLFNGVNQIIGGNLDIENFKNPDGVGTHVTSSAKVGPTIADDIKTSSFYAAVFALLLIFLYIFIRFSKWQYSLGAVGALAHDTLIVLSLFAMGHGILPFSLEIDQAFIAAILTVIGYSINDTVIVFDRIREYLGIYTDKPKDEVLNLAVNSTFSRTVITSLTTLFVILILFLFGGGSIKGFAFALLVGIIVGTYSSIFIATPIVRDLTGELKVKSKVSKKGFSRVKA